MSNFLDQKIDYLRGVGSARAELLNTELGIFTYGDLLGHYPFRYEDRSVFHKVSAVRNEETPFQVKGKVISTEIIGEKHKQRFVAEFADETGIVELVWFQGVKWIQKKVLVDGHYVIYGKASRYGSSFNFMHPEIELLTPKNEKEGYFQPIYPLTEKLRKKFVDSKVLASLVQNVLELNGFYIDENLPKAYLDKYKLLEKNLAIRNIHLPVNEKYLQHAIRRLKFEELFYNQLRLIKQKLLRKHEFAGQLFTKTELLTTFYKEHLPFELTNAQKRVIKEVFGDFKSGKQMNRLLQGDVGSGKTIVAFICMLMAIDGGAQTCLMAPTEILANQHFKNLKKFADLMGISIALLTGSVKKKDRRPIFEDLASGELKIIVGTHALLEDNVVFNNLGFCVIDEQHRFGVAQRAKLWNKNIAIHPHIFVMTATPIPRTLAMTLYGDLDISVIDELPAGRKPINTVHRYDSRRLEVFQFMRDEIEKGRQVYVVYPLIEESETMDYKNLMDGYESVTRAFPQYAISIVHGKMKAVDKEWEMQRFVKGEAKIMVATTVIEVGVDVPNASVMVIENAERFGLAQLHQLRGRVGRGAEQSACVLMSSVKLSTDSKKRIETMVRTNNGFEISEVDLELRGPGDLSGTQQSGLVDLKIANLATDSQILKYARLTAQEILEKDPNLESSENVPIKNFVAQNRQEKLSWSRIS